MPYEPLLDENGNPICDSQGYFIYVHTGGDIYQFNWIPSPSEIAYVQNIRGNVNGYPVVFTAILPMTESEIEYSFAKGDVVDWYVETVGHLGKKSYSEHNSFTVPYPSG